MLGKKKWQWNPFVPQARCEPPKPITYEQQDTWDITFSLFLQEPYWIPLPECLSYLASFLLLELYYKVTL